jgi:hypothetical protein
VHVVTGTVRNMRITLNNSGNSSRILRELNTSQMSAIVDIVVFLSVQMS